MECKVKNENGTIYISEDVMLKVVGYAALECYGIVAMAGKRATDEINEWLGRENLTKGVQIRNVWNTAFPFPKSAGPSSKPCVTSWKARPASRSAGSISRWKASGSDAPCLP